MPRFRQVRWNLPAAIASRLKNIHGESKLNIPNTPESEEAFALAMLDLGMNAWQHAIRQKREAHNLVQIVGTLPKGLPPRPVR